MCSTGFELHKQYELAEQAKTAAANQFTGEGSRTTDKHILAAKQRYVESFANWLSHRAFCHDCKPGAPKPTHQPRRQPQLA